MNGFFELSNAIEIISIIYVWTGVSLNRALVGWSYSFSVKLYQTITLQRNHCILNTTSISYIHWLYGIVLSSDTQDDLFHYY